MLLVVCDVDGTVTSRDTLDFLCQELAPDAHARLEGLLLNGNLTLREAISGEMTDICVSESDAVALAVNNISLRPGIHEFVDHVRSGAGHLVFLSAGFHELIRPMFAAANLPADLSIIANNIQFGIDGSHTSFREVSICSECGEQCKRSEVVELRETLGATHVVYIGDGYSDRCGAMVADTIFARDGLVSYLRHKSIKHIQFEDFYDVLKALQTVAESR